jgi:pyruvate dehydrogenase E2 component (dihydrolipoamide acetyltransferase)
LRWRRKVGEIVKPGDALVEIETDDGLAVVESGEAGTLKEILVPAGVTIQAGAPLALVGDATASASLNQPIQPHQTTPVTTQNTAVGNVTPILMPKAGQSMEEGVIVKWHVQPGASIKKGDVIFEIETDKATIEVEATDSGRLARVVVGEGGSSLVQQPVGYLADNDADVDAYIAGHAGGAVPAVAAAKEGGPARDADSAAPIISAPAATTESGRVKASPAARKVADERGIDLAGIASGSGPGGRILSTDVPAAAPAGIPVSAPAPTPMPSGDAPAGVVRKRMSGMRKAIARNLTLSKTTIPHWYLRCRLNAGPMMSFYKSQKSKVGCSVNDVIVMACARAIMEFPAMHSRVDGETILEYAGANIGIAVGMDDGLVVPVVLNAERLTLAQLAGETKRLANQARAGKIENMGQGIFTISNLGMYGVDDFVAIVNPPEAAILAVGAVREDVIVKDGAMRAGQTLTLTLSADHRLIDGTLGAQFMARLRILLEDPIQLIA